MKTITSDGLVYVYKTYKVIKLYWHVSFYNNIIIVIIIFIYIIITVLITDFSMIILASCLYYKNNKNIFNKNGERCRDVETQKACDQG